jgi:hypothetical protein
VHQDELRSLLPRRLHCEYTLTISKRTFRDLQEKYINIAKHLMMEGIRRMEAMEDNEATEDEVCRHSDVLEVWHR